MILAEMVVAQTDHLEATVHGVTNCAKGIEITITSEGVIVELLGEDGVEDQRGFITWEDIL